MSFIKDYVLKNNIAEIVAEGINYKIVKKNFGNRSVRMIDDPGWMNFISDIRIRNISIQSRSMVEQIKSKKEKLSFADTFYSKSSVYMELYSEWDVVLKTAPYIFNEEIECGVYCYLGFTDDIDDYSKIELVFNDILRSYTLKEVIKYGFYLESEEKVLYGFDGYSQSLIIREY